ncbi:HD domain-containing protein [Aureispira anguillae]|uniref:HD domain-containing protein n=1 Tax=Aureispira anguillae TaxID=2864201 RepID=A0A915YIE8_9BACT|nr:HD domain-containing protein [Aureispira anguillae]BDS13772.1 HD domain-containing protein [Aureispira anguillae]
MWNQDLYLEALIFAGKAHSKQKVPASDMSYVVHITNVAMEVANALVHSNDPNLNGTLAIQCALLHDTIEDTTVTYENIEEQFGQPIADGVLALTKNNSLPKEEQMLDSLKRIVKQGAEVRMVKMADRINNLQAPPAHWDAFKIRRYQKEAQLILDSLGGINPYIEARLSAKIKNYQQYCD